VAALSPRIPQLLRMIRERLCSCMPLRARARPGFQFGLLTTLRGGCEQRVRVSRNRRTR
jgi:hypothetical protein